MASGQAVGGAERVDRDGVRARDGPERVAALDDVPAVGVRRGGLLGSDPGAFDLERQAFPGEARVDVRLVGTDVVVGDDAAEAAEAPGVRGAELRGRDVGIDREALDELADEGDRSFDLGLGVGLPVALAAPAVLVDVAGVDLAAGPVEVAGALLGERPPVRQLDADAAALDAAADAEVVGPEVRVEALVDGAVAADDVGRRDAGLGLAPPRDRRRGGAAGGVVEDDEVLVGPGADVLAPGQCERAGVDGESQRAPPESETAVPSGWGSRTGASIRRIGCNPPKSYSLPMLEKRSPD